MDGNYTKCKLVHREPRTCRVIYVYYYYYFHNNTLHAI